MHQLPPRLHVVRGLQSLSVTWSQKKSGELGCLFGRVVITVVVSMLLFPLSCIDSYWLLTYFYITAIVADGRILPQKTLGHSDWIWISCIPDLEMQELEPEANANSACTLATQSLERSAGQTNEVASVL